MKRLKKRLNLGKELIEVINNRLKESNLEKPIAAILKGTSEDDESLVYMLGLYEKYDLPEEDPVYLVSWDELELFIPQKEVLECLIHNTLNIIDGKITIEKSNE